MRPRYALLAGCLLMLAGCSRMPDEATSTSSGAVTGDQADATEAFTETERQVQQLMAEEGIYVVHFWAPWCHNSMSEFRSGVWNEIVAAHEDVTFIFVTVFNDGELGESTLAKYAIPDRVHTFAQPDRGPSDDKANRRTTFLNVPLAWTPTTWIFHDGGTLAYALNYGEVHPDLMQTLLDNMATDWSH